MEVLSCQSQDVVGCMQHVFSESEASIGKIAFLQRNSSEQNRYNCQIMILLNIPTKTVWFIRIKIRIDIQGPQS